MTPTCLRTVDLVAVAFSTKSDLYSWYSPQSNHLSAALAGPQILPPKEVRNPTSRVDSIADIEPGFKRLRPWWRVNSNGLRVQGFWDMLGKYWGNIRVMLGLYRDSGK